MKLTDKEVAALSRGALYTETDGEGYLVFHRFTKKIEDFYGTFNPNFAMKAAATSGVCLHFTTDAAALSFEYASKVASSRKFDYFDITVDGALVAHPGKEDGAGETGTVSLSLGAGAHTVCVYLPALAALRVRCFTLDNATYCTPVKRARKLYCLGDSITQGYDAWYPMQSYATLLSDKLEAEILNHGIGGEVFRPDMLDPDLPFDPDIVTVAYGTNDWSHVKRDDLIRNANGFYARLRAQFPKAKIFAITPIWRADNDRVTDAGTFGEGVAIIRAAAEAQTGVVVIEGVNLAPHLTEFYSDLRLHPNDAGFRFYAEALYRAMLPHLD